ALRATLVAGAGEVIKAREPSTTSTRALETELEQMGVPIGWSGGFVREGTTAVVSAVLVKLAGLLITVFAIALGAPFWFDLLSKVVSLRSPGNPPAKSKATPADAAAPAPVI